MHGRIGERIFDMLVSGAALVALSPFLVAIAIAVRASLGKPIVFRQERIGLGGRRFVLYKFRTMREEWNQNGDLLPDGDRLTSFGKWLRSTSLDELPELWNVLRGDMRLVGPRPLLPAYVPRYTPRQMRRHEVKPGITGWAQVNGRNAVSWEEKFEMDVWYVDHHSFWLDLRILGLTILSILRREGISEPGHATAQEFMGSAVEAGGN